MNDHTIKLFVKQAQDAASFFGLYQTAIYTRLDEIDKAILSIWMACGWNKMLELQDAGHIAAQGLFNNPIIKQQSDLCRHKSDGFDSNKTSYWRISPGSAWFCRHFLKNMKNKFVIERLSYCVIEPMYNNIEATTQPGRLRTADEDPGAIQQRSTLE